jgi:hypothetical protein
MAAFADTFLVFDRALRAGATPMVSLAETVRAADPDGLERSEWRTFADYVAVSLGGR